MIRYSESGSLFVKGGICDHQEYENNEIVGPPAATLGNPPRAARFLGAMLPCLVVIGVAACSSGEAPGEPEGGQSHSEPPARLDIELRDTVESHALTGDPASVRGAVQIAPDDDPLVKLGQLLFFSQTLAADYDVACGTCHHPDFGGSDGLSLSVGVVPVDASRVGPGRRVDPARDLDPSADGGPNMHRNSITTFNSALFDRALMYDGRAFVLEEPVAAGGHGQLVKTPESGQRPDSDPVSGLLEFTVKGPLVNDNEMRGYAYTNYATPPEYRDHLVRRLRGNVDAENNSISEADANWLALFRAAFNAKDASADDVITMPNVQRALGAYVASQVFVSTPWREYLNGGNAAIDDNAKRGARLFLTAIKDGGLGCAACHSGDRFTDESFHNVGFPQLGRGFLRADGSDPGRWNVTLREAEVAAFRTPSLLNISGTAPYGHAGSFTTLEEVLAYHADPRAGVEDYDFSLSHLNQFRVDGIEYADAESHTRAAIAEPSFDSAEALLPGRRLTPSELAQLTAFLETLTDRCVAAPSCIGRWAPMAGEDPDGHTLMRNASASRPPESSSATPSDYPEHISLALPPTEPRSTFADLHGCTNQLVGHRNSGETSFIRRDGPGFGLDDPHGYSAAAWFDDPSLVEAAMIGGGVSTAYLDDDCWPDLVFTGGEASGLRMYRNVYGLSFEPANWLTEQPGSEFSGAAIADLDGDYRRELLLGNVKPGAVLVYAQNGASMYQVAATLPMQRPTYGISFAPLDSTGQPYFYLAHWAAGSGTEGTAPALWRSDGETLRPWDTKGRTSSAYVDQRFNFTPKFADFSGDGRIDLVIASDFSTSAVLRNAPDGGDSPAFMNETDNQIITDQNGMGSALFDIDNDGDLDWFVTSVFDSDEPMGNWGMTGNRLYRNISTVNRMGFEDITAAAGVRNGNWGWGTCAEDFNNDGFIDLFHVNGFGYIPDSVVVDDESRRIQDQYNGVTAGFQGVSPLLFMNDGEGAFTEETEAWSIDVPSEGRGLVCFDYDRDGDVDISVFNHSAGLQFFENASGSGAGRRFIDIRLVGAAPNTDAIGAEVYVTADLGGGYGVQRQLRVAAANSNFNSQNLPNMHFGLGEAEIMERLAIVWPDGDELLCERVPVNRFLVLDERDGEAACPVAE